MVARGVEGGGREAGTAEGQGQGQSGVRSRFMAAPQRWRRRRSKFLHGVQQVADGLQALNNWPARGAAGPARRGAGRGGVGVEVALGALPELGSEGGEGQAFGSPRRARQQGVQLRQLSEWAAQL